MNPYQSIALQNGHVVKLGEDAKDWAYAHGHVMRSKENAELVSFAPFTLFPAPFPEKLYNEAVAVQKDFHDLYHKASLDEEFIDDALRSVILHDDFTKRIYEIYKTIRKEGGGQKKHLYMFRSDYMLDYETPPTSPADLPTMIKQIEVNLIAASFSGLCYQTSRLHGHVADTLGDTCPYNKSKLPKNISVEGLAEGLAIGWHQYEKSTAVVVFVVHGGERNRFDQRSLQYNFQEKVKKYSDDQHVPVWFLNFGEIHQKAKLENGTCYIDGREVAIFYFRTGYSPSSYVNEADWDARLLIERSDAIKTPNAAGHLVGCKKIQQVFANPGVVERFIKDPDAVKRIRRTFAGLYTLDEGEEGDRAQNLALTNPEKYVLKPQREGGGNNFYGDAIVEQLKSIADVKERSQYILMDKICPPVYKNYIVHLDFDKPSLLDVVNELGIYGIYVVDGDTEVANEVVGHLVRTKSIEHEDGGVNAGRAVLDSPLLI